MESDNIEIYMFVDYDSYDEFLQLVSDLAASYKEMATYMDINLNDVNMFHPEYPMFSLYERGLILWSRLTKNKLKTYCKIHSNALAVIIANFKINCLIYSNVNNVEEMMHNTIDFYLFRDNGSNLFSHFSPVFCIFEDIIENSFVRLTCSFDSELMIEKWVPLNKYRKYQMAVAMGLHKRLGKESVFRVLSDDLIKKIWNCMGISRRNY